MRTDPAKRLPFVTVVCPVFNEERSVPLFFDRLTSALKPSESRVRFEFLFVDNRSSDTTRDVIRNLQERDPRVNLLALSRNFGYQASITAGMRHARGDAIVNIDVDCEDPPEMIPRLIERWLEGADVAYGIREKRDEFVLMHLARKLFYRATRKMADHEIVLDMAEFFLVDKRVRDHVLSTRSTFPFVRGQVGYVGFRREGIPYKREHRLVGETHYNLVSAIRFGLAGILSSSTFPLRALAYVGVTMFLFDSAVAIAAFALGTQWGLSLQNRILIGLAAVHLGLVALAFGTVGLYLARVYKDTLGLPLYIVDDRTSSMRSLEGAPPEVVRRLDIGEPRGEQALK
jgi:glycosyltransferase involved in cell wall biosynthesis